MSAEGELSPFINSKVCEGINREPIAESKRRKIVMMRVSAFSVPDRTDGVCLSEECDTTDCDPLEKYFQEGPEYDEEWDWSTENWKRGCKHCRSTSSHKKPKPAPHRLVRASTQRKVSRKKEHVHSNAEAQKDNNERRLQKRHIARFGYEIYYKRSDCIAGGKRPTRVTAPRSYLPHKDRSKCKHRSSDHPAALLYELKQDDESDDFSRLLVDLQHRDLTPEDYDLLLRLDEKVTPKTVSESALSSFDTLTLESTSVLIGELCSICMEVYSESQSVKTLPCQHTFHCSCINTWLSAASLNCPLDGIAVQS